MNDQKARPELAAIIRVETQASLQTQSARWVETATLHQSTPAHQWVTSLPTGVGQLKGAPARGGNLLARTSVLCTRVHLQSHLLKTGLSCNRGQGPRWTLLAPRGARWRPRGTAWKFGLQTGKCAVLRLSGVRSKFQKKPLFSKSGQEGYTSGASWVPGGDETETRWWEGGFQEDPEPEGSEWKMNRVEIKAEKESGDTEFRRELRNSLRSQDT